MSEETRTVRGSNHLYVFPIMTARQAIGVMNDWIGIIGERSDDIIAAVSRWLSDDREASTEPADLFAALMAGDSVIIDAFKTLSSIVTTPRLFDLAKILLTGATIDGVPCDSDGMHALFRKRPHEIYLTLFWAIAANYEDYLPFLREGDDTGDNDSPPTNNPNETGFIQAPPA